MSRSSPNRSGAIGSAVLRTPSASTIVLDGVPHTVIGIVADRDFVITVQFLTPLAADLAQENRSNHMMAAIGRLRPGVTLAQAQREMDGIALQLGKEFPKDDADWGVTMATFYDWIVPESTRTGLYILLTSVGLVLLIACTNIANLTLARRRCGAATRPSGSRSARAAAGSCARC